MGGNSQKHVHGQILRKLVPQGGRIPVVVVIGAGTDALVEGLVRRLRDAGLAVGRATTQGAWLDGQACGQPDGLASAIRVLLSNRRVEALLVQVGDADAWKSGWPFDRADVLAVVDPIGTPQAIVDPCGNHADHQPRQDDHKRILDRHQRAEEGGKAKTQ